MQRLIPIIALVLTACRETTKPVVCERVAIPGIQISIRDSTSNIPFTRQVTAVAREGTFGDSILVNNPYQIGDLNLVHDRPGTYSVSIRAMDYTEWKATNVTVTKTVCGVNTVHLVALMQKDNSTTFSASYGGGRGEFSDQSLVRVRLTAGAFSLVITAPDLWPKTFVIPTSGTAAVRFSLVTPANDTLGTGQTTFDLAPGWSFGVSGYVATAPPLGVCTGTFTKVPLRSATNTPVTDTLYISVAGLPRGAIC
ncbi:MAG TPA: hypothetical protein VM100_12350 [Longimicrobiales bacterium]|nr:hypothetical protein [Longimicrobiales bacterium]